jgi:YD repeat-containing protein
LARTREIYQLGHGDPRLLSRNLDPTVPGQPGEDLITEYFYYPGVSGANPFNPNAGRLKGFERYDGYWEQYEYDLQGRTIKTWRAYADVPYGDLQAAELTETYFYETGFPGLDWRQVVTVDEVEIERTYLWRDDEELITKTIRATEAEAAWNASTNLVTEVQRRSSDNRVIRRVDEQGIVSLYEYDTTGTNLITTTDRGVPNGAGTAIDDGIRTIETINLAGIVVEREVRDIKTNLLIDSMEVIDTDYLMRAIDTVYADGTSEQRTFGSTCCAGQIVAMTDRQGLTTTYSYDLLGRRISETRQGITRLTAYDAAGRVTRVSREAGVTTLVLQETDYDLAGRVLEQRQAGPYDDGTLVATTYAYDYPSEGGTVTTVTRPDGSTQITTTYADGRTALIEGTGVVPMKMTYTTFTDGGLSGLAERTIRLMPDGENWLESEWTETRLVMGRPVATLMPGSAETTMAYDAFGRLASLVDPDGVTTLFAVSTLFDIVILLKLQS